MPFVPRSIITKDHISSKSSCAIEIIGFGSCINQIWKINTIKDDDEIKEISNAYQINRKTLEFAAQFINDLRADFPSVSFSITGKFFTFKFDNRKEFECELNHSDLNPSTNNVFDANHPSHLVLLVDKKYPNRPQAYPFCWLQEFE